MKTLALLLVVALANGEEVFRARNTIEYVNGVGASWTAGVNAKFEGMPKSQVREMMGVIMDEEMRKVAKLPVSDIEVPAEIPDTFDARTQWPACADVINNIRDQSACGSCWAVAAAGAMSDRLCIATGGAKKTSLSAKDLLSCCGLCGHGCQGGYPSEAWSFARNTGLVTGGGYGDKNTCEPYPFPKCEHHNNHTTYPACPAKTYSTPKCTKECQTDYKNNTFGNDKTKAKSHYSIRGVEKIQTEIMTKGSVEVSFTVYEDFLAYKSGVYVHKTGGYEGGHAVRAVGWGTENNQPYWLIANSWNDDWGDKGYFKILRGVNECGVEGGVVAGEF